MANLVTKLEKLATTVIKVGTPKVQTILYYAKTELVPPTPKDIPEIKNRINNIIRGYKTGAWKQLTVREAFLNTLITTEVVCWFFLGECIGKRHFIGYDLSM